MPPTRGHDLKLSQHAPLQETLKDAPHTGARLETILPCLSWLNARMPPTRGHDLKLVRIVRLRIRFAMPPTRGHDLKRLSQTMPTSSIRMPPTRGHDLKPLGISCGTATGQDAPHTGARLETSWPEHEILGPCWMPPTRGHDLKQSKKQTCNHLLGCPPHGGTT